MKNFIMLLIKGIFVGVANIIPGVSGGTIAVVLGIFDRLIDAINNFYKDLKKYFIFLIPIGLGMVFGIVGFSTVIDFTLTNYSLPTTLFFIGLVVGSIPLIYKKATEKSFKPIYVVPTIIACLIVVLFSVLSPDEARQTGAVDMLMMIKLFFGGIIAAAAMVIPGISGSFMMVLMGLYSTVLHTIAGIKDYLRSPADIQLLIGLLSVLIPLGIGVVIGILLISKVIAILMKKYYSITYFSIFGLMLGSIFGMFNDPITYQSGVNAMAIVISVITFAVGFALSTVLGKE